MRIKTLIMAGGKGSRISELFPDIPKPLIPITNSNGVTKPVLEWEICNLKSQGLTDIIISVSYMADKIQSYFGDGSRYGVNIEYFYEDKPLGNGGALVKLRDKLSNTTLILNADSVFDIDFIRFIDFHIKHNSLVTLFTHPNNHPYDSGLIISSDNCTVDKWLTKEDERPKYYKNRVNAGLQLINSSLLKVLDIKPESVNSNNRIDLDRNIFKPLCGTGQMFVYDSPEYCKDMGTPERYRQVCEDFRKGIVSKKNLKNKQRAIFLDRDGTINKYIGFLTKINEFELLPGVSDAIKLINLSGFLCIIVTNQPVIARGEISLLELKEIHNKMEVLLGNNGAYIDGLYYCPHHPDKGFSGEVVELKINCDCRKPKPGLLLQAATDFNIDLESSWMIGDSLIDICAGKAAGCHTALIGNCDYGQDLTGENLLELVRNIINLER